MLCVKSAGGRAREVDLAISGFLKRDGEGLHWLMQFAGKCNDRATVRSTAQIASRDGLRTALEMTMDRRPHGVAQFLGPMASELHQPEKTFSIAFQEAGYSEI